MGRSLLKKDERKGGGYRIEREQKKIEGNSQVHIWEKEQCLCVAMLGRTPQEGRGEREKRSRADRSKKILLELAGAHQVCGR